LFQVQSNRPKVSKLTSSIFNTLSTNSRKMSRILNFAAAALLLLHATNASMNPLMLSRTAMLTSIRKADGRSGCSPSSLNMQSPSPNTCIDEWYDNGCDELLEASNTYERHMDVHDEKEVAMCSVSYKRVLQV